MREFQDGYWTIADVDLKNEKSKFSHTEIETDFEYCDPSSPLILDSDVLLRAIQYSDDNEKLSEYLNYDIESIVIPNTVMKEVENKIRSNKNKNELLSRLKKFKNRVICVKPDYDVLLKLESEHKRMAEQPESKMARLWLRWKKRDILKNGGKVPETTIERVAELKRLCENASNDRNIVAVAVSIAEPYKNKFNMAQVSDDIALMLASLRKKPKKERITVLMSCDGDILVLEKIVAQITESTLYIQRPPQD